MAYFKLVLFKYIFLFNKNLIKELFNKTFTYKKEAINIYSLISQIQAEKNIDFNSIS